MTKQQNKNFWNDNQSMEIENKLNKENFMF